MIKKVKIGSSLSDNSRIRYFTFIVLYFSQGIPEGITIFGIPAWLAMNGKSSLEIAGYSAIVIIPFTLKILLAPFMERYTYLPMGRRKPWLLFGQFGIFCSIIMLSQVSDPLNNVTSLAFAALVVHIFIVFQDVSTDSLVIDIVPAEQQGKANSLMWGSKAIGTSISLIAGSWIINHHGLELAVLTMSVCVFLVMMVPLLLKERKGEKLFPWSIGEIAPEAALLAIDSWTKLFKSFIQVVMLRNTLLLLSTLFIALAAIHYVRTLLPIFTIQELGWTNQYYSNVFSMASLAGGICGMLLGGLIIKRFGVVHMIQGSLLLVAVLVLAMSFLSRYWSNEHFVSAFIGLFCTLITLIIIGALALAMLLCWKRISALQFTFCMTIYNLGLSAGAALLGFLREFFEWNIIFMIFSLLVVVAIIILRNIKTQRHLEQVNRLEGNYLEILKEEGKLMVHPEPS